MNEEKEKKREPEMGVLTVLFILLCAVVILSIFIDWGTEVSGYVYALIALIGVVTCARDKAFMAVDSLVEVYPDGLKKVVKKIKDILMVIVFAALFVISILGVINQIQTPTYSDVLGIPNLILYVVQVIVYPFAVYYYIRAIMKEAAQPEAKEE